MVQAKLSDDIKLFIVQALACFDTPSEVVVSVKKEFDVDVSRQLVETHDPTKAAGKNTAKAWKEIFASTREAYLTNTAEIPLAHRAVRLRVLQRMAAAAEKSKNFSMTAQLIEQIAKECGDAYSNRQRVEVGKPGDFDNMSPDDLRDFIRSEAEALGVGHATAKAARGNGTPRRKSH